MNKKSAKRNRWKFCLGGKPKTDADKMRLLAQVKYAINVMNVSYERNAIKELKNSIITSEMGKMGFYANVVASQAAHNGWSSQAKKELREKLTGAFGTHTDIYNPWSAINYFDIEKNLPQEEPERIHKYGFAFEGKKVLIGIST